jgi:methylmalonyl-CoA mutase N-terminal domain/subunit
MGATGPMGSGDPSAGADILGSRIAEQQARSRNSERQRRLESDTDKLVGLVNEFKQQLQDEKQLSPADVSKRAEEIEKLARSVKDRMKG